MSNLPGVFNTQATGDGDVVAWVTGSVPNRKVLYFDGSTTTIVGASTFTIEDPKVSGQGVVWESFKQSGNLQREIYYYNGSIVLRLTTNDFGDFDPQISDGHVVWWGGVFNDFQIQLFDGTSVRQLSNGIRNQYPQIDGPNVVWQGYDGHDDEIFLWNGHTVTQITDNDVDDTRPQISGNHIVWQHAEPFNGNSQEIYHTYFTTDKATPANVTSYNRGINGIMVDVDGAAGTLSVDDFQFKMGTNNSPGSWGDAPAPTAFSVRPGAGESGSDRVEITWATGAVTNTWLEVTVRGNDPLGGFDTNTGLATSDVFYFGNRVGDTFLINPPMHVLTNATDEIQARANGTAGAGVENPYDFNRDGFVNATDQILARSNGGFMPLLSVGSQVPMAEFLTATPPHALVDYSAISIAVAADAVARPTTVAAVLGAGTPAVRYDLHTAAGRRAIVRRIAITMVADEFACRPLIDPVESDVVVEALSSDEI